MNYDNHKRNQKAYIHVLCELSIESFEFIIESKNAWKMNNDKKDFVHLYCFREYNLSVDDVIKIHVKRSPLGFCSSMVLFKG